MNRNRAFSLLFALAWLGMMGPLSGCNAPLSKNEPVADAADSQNRAIQLDQKQKAEIQMGLARTLEMQGDLERAETIYREILATRPKYAPALHRLAVLCDLQGRFEESKPLFLKAIDQTSEDQVAVIWGDYGYSLYRQQEWEEAETTLRKALQLNSRDKRAHNHLGLVLAQTGQAEAAMAEFLLAGCSEAEARANMNIIRKLNNKPALTNEAPTPSLKSIRRNSQDASQEGFPDPTAEPPSAPTRTNNPGTATVHVED